MALPVDQGVYLLGGQSGIVAAVIDPPDRAEQEARLTKPDWWDQAYAFCGKAWTPADSVRGWSYRILMEDGSTEEVHEDRVEGVWVRFA